MHCIQQQHWQSDGTVSSTWLYSLLFAMFIALFVSAAMQRADAETKSSESVPVTLWCKPLPRTAAQVCPLFCLLRSESRFIQWQATTDRSCCQPACLQGSLHQSVREIARRTSYSTMMGYSVSAFLSSLLGLGTCTRQVA